MPDLFSPDKSLVILNPASGSRTSQKRGQTLAALLHKKKYPVIHTEYRGHASKLASDAAAGEKKSVIIVGGDGTLFEVLQGLTAKVALAYFPGGSVNLFALNYQIPSDPQVWVKMLESREVQPFYFGSANNKPFGAIASVGIDAYAVANVNTNLKKIIGVAAYGVELFFDLFTYRQPEISVTIDGTLCNERVLGVLVGRGSHYGGKYCILPDCKPEERRLSYAILTGRSKGNYLRYGWGMVFETMRNQKGVISGYAEQIKIETSFQTPVQVDGDLFGATPVTFSVEHIPRMVLL